MSGGKRPSTGRPKGTGQWGETTVPLRIPVSMMEKVQDCIERKGWQLPVYTAANLPHEVSEPCQGCPKVEGA